jgi:glutamate/aspartate transport system permease protein
MNYAWNWGVLLQKTPDGSATYLDWLISGLGWTVAVSLSAWVLALALGAMLGVMRTAPNKWLSGIATAYVEIFRNIPLLVQLFVWYFVVPELLPFGLGDRVKQMDPTLNAFLTSFICLGLFTAARVCEQVRAGVNSLAKGQKNAGLAMGLTLWQTYKFVLLPMAFRIVIPPLGSEFMNIFKNSSVALTIGLLELTAQSRQIAEYTANTFEAFIAATVLYIAITLTAVTIMRGLEQHFRVPGYSSGGGGK